MKTKYQLMSWEELRPLALSTARQIRASGFTPDVVIALSRGGLVPARVICDFLVLKNLVSIKVEHWGITAHKDKQTRITHSIDMDLTGKNVLVIDDITDTGDSLLKVIEHVHGKGAKEIKTATLLHILTSKYEPDFYGDEMEWAWVVFPWNFYEDMSHIITQKLGNKLWTLIEFHTQLVGDGVHIGMSELRWMLTEMKATGQVTQKEKDNKVYWGSSR